jgi:hypothetical protein
MLEPGFRHAGRENLENLLEALMRYLVLIYTNPAARELWNASAASDKAVDLEAYARFNTDLTDSGELIVSESLTDAAETRQVIIRGGQVTTTDGPFAETKEQLAGFYLVECDDLDRATEIAARIPEAEAGVIEIRPVRTLSGLEM